jgi:hypothetical protein
MGVHLRVTVDVAGRHHDTATLDSEQLSTSAGA